MLGVGVIKTVNRIEMVLARLFFKDITSICKLNKYKALFSLIPVTYFDY